jgi:hypothetical protein
MNSPYNASLAQNRDQGARRNGHAQVWRYRSLVGIAVMMAMGVGLYLFHLTAQTTRATSVNSDPALLYELVANGQGDEALQQLAALAVARGGWGPAPGDGAVFAPAMRLAVASTVAIDMPPEDCAVLDPTAPQSPDCMRDFQRDQNLLRFGPATFETTRRDGTFAPRATVDDILSVYIEEVGHSWQEYCYETEGRCQGERTRLTTWSEGKQRAAGWEYQIKMYILSLDGTRLELSDGERGVLTTAICSRYADPRYTVVSVYGPPPGWPNPAGWPTAAPTEEEFQAFCQGRQ